MIRLAGIFIDESAQACGELLRTNEAEEGIRGGKAIDGRAEAYEIIGRIVQRLIVHRVDFIRRHAASLFFQTEFHLLRDVARVECAGIIEEEAVYAAARRGGLRAFGGEVRMNGHKLLWEGDSEPAPTANQTEHADGDEGDDVEDFGEEAWRYLMLAAEKGLDARLCQLLGAHDGPHCQT